MPLFRAEASDAFARTGRVRYALLNSLLVFGGEFLQDLLLVADVEANLQKVVGVNAQLVLTERVTERAYWLAGHEG